MKNKSQKGFTLIELMIVVAIIGILASIALPAYQTYVAKTKITSAYATIASAKTIFFEYYVNHGKMPVNINDAGGVTDFYNSIKSDLAGGSRVWYQRLGDTQFQLFVTFKNINGFVNGKGLSIHFRDRDDKMIMTCHATGGLPYKYLPKQCQQGYIP